MSDTDSTVTVVNTGDGSNPTDVSGLSAVMAEIGNPEKALSSDTEDVQDNPSTSSSATEANTSVEPVDRIEKGEDSTIMAPAAIDEKSKHTDDSSTMSTATDEHENHDTGDLAGLPTTSTDKEPNADVSSPMSTSPVDKHNETREPAVLSTTATDEELNAVVSSTMSSTSAENHNESGDPAVHPAVLPTTSTDEESKNLGNSASMTTTSANELNETGAGLDIEATASKDSSGAGSGSDGNVTRPVSPNSLFERADNVVATAGTSIFNCDSYGVTDSPRIPTAANGKQPASPSTFTSAYIEPASSAEGVDNAEVSLGLVGTNGQPVTEATEPDLFEDWIEYLVYCEQGEHISCQFGTRDEDNNFSIEKEIRVPKKLLCDHSPALKSMLTGPWVEAQTGVLILDDIYAGDFYRLVQILKAGLSHHDVNLGKEENILSNLFRAYILADRYLMDKTKTWIAGAILKSMTHTSQSWKYEYGRDVRSGLPSVERGGFHFAKLEDLVDVHWLIADKPEVRMPLNRRGMAGFIASNCPRNLLLQMWAAEELTNELMFDIGVHLVARIH